MAVTLNEILDVNLREAQKQNSIEMPALAFSTAIDWLTVSMGSIVNKANPYMPSFRRTKKDTVKLGFKGKICESYLTLIKVGVKSFKHNHIDYLSGNGRIIHDDIQSSYQDYTHMNAWVNLDGRSTQELSNIDILFGTIRPITDQIEYLGLHIGNPDNSGLKLDFSKEATRLQWNQPYAKKYGKCLFKALNRIQVI